MRIYPPRTGILVFALMFAGFGSVESYSRYVSPRPKFRALAQYPFELKKAKITGEVIVEFIVDSNGKVRNPFVVRSTHQGFNEAAVLAISKWKFAPGNVDGRAVNTRMRIPITFSLEGEGRGHRLNDVLRPLGEELFSKLPKEMAYDEPPKLEHIENLVYPFSKLLENKRITMLGVAVVRSDGLIGEVTWKTEGVDQVWKLAATAMLETAKLKPATKKEKAVSTMMLLRVFFDTQDGSARISDSAAAILKRLRLEGPNVKFVSPRNLDEKIGSLKRINPVFPREFYGEKTEGKALIEFFIDKKGYAQLPRIISASEPAFGYAAVQAVAKWEFEPPLKDGKPVVVKVRVPVKFKRK